MIGLVVTGHGHFASGMREAVRVIAGEPEHVRWVDFNLNDSTDVLAGNLSRAYDELSDSDGVLTLADLTGGSPFNQAVLNGLPRGIETVAGCNLGMLLEVLTLSRSETDPRKLAAAALDAGRQTITWFQVQ